MSTRCIEFETAYADLLADLWDELEDVLEAHYGWMQGTRADAERLRLKLSELHSRVSALQRQRWSDASPGGVDRLDAFVDELLRLLDEQRREDDLELSCGAKLVLAQNRILREAQRIAHCGGSDGYDRQYA